MKTAWAALTASDGPENHSNDLVCAQYFVYLPWGRFEALFANNQTSKRTNNELYATVVTVDTLVLLFAESHCPSTKYS